LNSLQTFGLDAKYGKNLSLFFPWCNFSILCNVIQSFKVDVIHLHWQHPFLIDNTKFRTIIKSILFICQLIIAKMVGIKVIWTVHNLVNHNKQFIELELFFCDIIARLADKIIAHCNAAKIEIQTKFNVKKSGKIVVIPHGAFINFYDNTMSRIEARSRLGLSQNDLTFLFLGLIRPYKGVLELVDSFQNLHFSDAKLVIAGKDSDQQLTACLRKKIEGDSNILLECRYISDDEMQKYMEAADFVVFPYRDILTSGGIITGMAFGKAIIAPRIGCIPEILNSSGGFLYDPDDQEGLSNAMRRAAEISMAKIQEMGKYNFCVAIQMDWQSIAASTFRVYEDCIGHA
jgi:glycosyltransferase involved in cell wall biosynthesis